MLNRFFAGVALLRWRDSRPSLASAALRHPADATPGHPWPPLRCAILLTRLPAILAFAALRHPGAKKRAATIGQPASENEFSQRDSEQTEASR